MDEKTRLDIDKLVSKAIQKVGFKDPPITLEPILHELEVNRNFVEIEDPSLIRRFLNKLSIGGDIFTKILKTIKLEGIWFPEEKRILIETSLPKPKKDWASFHETTHRLLPWHRQYFLGDTAQTLDADFREKLESQANYGACALMFGGAMFTKEALDTVPGWTSIEMLNRRHKKSLVTILRRYVEFSHDIPMAMVISTPYWKEMPDDQKHGIRRLVLSNRFINELGSIDRESILNLITQNSAKRRGGIVGEFHFRMKDLNGIFHPFHVEIFFNQHYLLSLITPLSIS